MSHIAEYFLDIIDLVDDSVYWKDENGYYLGCNLFGLKKLGFNCQNDIIGKTDYDLFDKKVADKFKKNDLKVMKENVEVSFEEEILLNGKRLFNLSRKKPLYNKNKLIIGTIGITIDITAKKEAHALKIENSLYQAEKKAQESFIKFIDEMLNMIHKFKFNAVNKKLGLRNKTSQMYSSVKLTKREEQILYFLAIGKSPKEIATILSKFENKTISDATVGGMINKQLYPKLEVASYGQLIDRATNLGLIPFIPKSLSGLLTKD